MTTVRGLSWAHTRGHAPLVATSRAWTDFVADVDFAWHPRTLAEFADGGLAGYLGSYDLVVLDHPLIGEAAQAGWLQPLDGDAGRDAAGACFDSYTCAGRQWALPLDAAAQCSAWRRDLLGGAPPATWDELVALAAETGRVATPLSIFSVVATFLSLVVQLGGDPFADPARVVERAIGERALELLGGLVAHVAPWCHDAGAVQLLGRLATSDDLHYVAYAYGYSTYARAGYAEAAGGHRLRFGDPPPVVAGQVARPVLGGTGIALLHGAPSAAAATDYLRWVVSPGCQRTLYTQAGGQPAAAAAWDDADLDALCGGFFSGTRASLDAAWVRPRSAWFARFQPAAGRSLQRFVRGQAGPGEVLDDLDDLQRQTRTREAAAAVGP